METEPRESDQLPEDAPEQVAEDDQTGDRDEGGDLPPKGEATGNPGNAG